MTHDRVYSGASKVVAEGGHVIIDGPGSVAVTMTPEAALETGGRLIDAAAEAAGQRRIEAGDAEG